MPTDALAFQVGSIGVREHSRGFFCRKIFSESGNINLNVVPDLLKGIVVWWESHLPATRTLRVRSLGYAQNFFTVFSFFLQFQKVIKNEQNLREKRFIFMK